MIAAIVLAMVCMMSGEHSMAATTDFYVSPSGVDSNPGTSEKPFATAARARDAVRKLVAAGLRAPVTVYLAGGTYYLSEGLALGAEDSGTAEHSITYRSVEGQTAVLVGGAPLTGWRKHKGEIYVADLPVAQPFHAVNAQAGKPVPTAQPVPLQLFENGKRLTLARIPKKGYFHTDSGDKASSLIYHARDFDPTGWNVKPGRVFLWPVNDWFSREEPIKSIDPAKHKITLTGKAITISGNNRFFVRNVLDLLTAPGECVIDHAAGVVYAWPADGPIDKQTMVLPTAKHVIEVRGREGAPVRNVHFADLDIGVANEHAMMFDGVEDCSVQRCRVENAGLCGISIHGYAQRVVVRGNEIRRHGQHGVNLSGLRAGQADVNHHHEIVNNHIHHCGRLIGHGYGVSISQSGHNRVLHNHIHDMPRYATTIKGTRYQVLKTQVAGVTFKNRHTFLHSRNNLIAYNHIHHVNQDSQDTGAMESWGPGRDNVYDHNLIHDVGVGGFSHDLQSGMYLDDATDYFTLTNNIIYNIGGKTLCQPIFVKGIGNVIDNNVLIVAANNDCGIRSMFMADERCDHHAYTHNIIVLQNPKAVPYHFWTWSDNRVAASDHNVFWNAGKGIAMGGDTPAKTLDAWRALGGKGFDKHSIVADPLFENAAAHDYRLKPNSPALTLGIKSIDTSAIGLLADFPARLREK
ncbi:MAG: right-handed parallel beta-helix repeat-containing protein [Planctomycetaceae bacterium]|nr:right-handed parallel beta-helix repeat-containing protein [Planctomycetaceae bacterium]